MANVTPSLNQPKSREREGFKEDGRETKPIVKQKQLHEQGEARLAR